MKIAFISDIHANLPALQAVLADIVLQEPDDIYCLGDLVNFAGWDNEVIELIRTRGITTVQGNHDEGIGYQLTQFPYSYTSREQKIFGEQSIRQVETRITAGNRSFLRNLPFSVRMEYRFPFHSFYVCLLHGSPVGNDDYIRPDVPDDHLREQLEAADADILLMGHTHQPFHRPVYCEQQNRKFYRHAINVGSVGKPKHGDPSACYVLLEFGKNLQLEDPGSIRVTFRYVPYDVEAVLAQIHRLGLGNAYDEGLRKGQ
ncbi:MAG TPA: metallophosphoesterase family protein [Puia sp.]|uniref:metallophosphoesterase family protein n=1 Tax=Puia sp. TaxID=2045100 RepID=UPI002BD3D64A|nr:metallophosphoesterase family protein [Puia sp.]HVU93684.1 metallophosphoesterase family protein [Puia sp.]